MQNRDVVAPTLSSATAGTPTSDGATNFGVTTNEGNGTLYWAVVTDGGSCTDAQLKAGTGGNIVAGKSGTQAISSTGAKTIDSVTGLSSSTTYQFKFLHSDAAGNDSAQASVSLTTAAAGVTYATWDPADKGSNVTLSNGNLTAAIANGSTQASTKATIGKSSGKWYWELKFDSTTSGSHVTVGIASSAIAVNGYIGLNATNYSYFSGNGQKYNNAGGAAYGATWTTGDVIGIALDMTGGTLTFYKNNVSQGTAYTGLSGTFYPAVGGDASGAGTTCTTTVNFGATALTYSPPAGYNAGVYT